MGVYSVFAVVSDEAKDSGWTALNPNDFRLNYWNAVYHLPQNCDASGEWDREALADSIHPVYNQVWLRRPTMELWTPSKASQL